MEIQFSAHNGRGRLRKRQSKRWMQRTSGSTTQRPPEPRSTIAARYVLRRPGAVARQPTQGLPSARCPT